MIKKLLTLLLFCGTIEAKPISPQTILEVITTRTGVKTEHITVESIELKEMYMAVTCNQNLIVVNDLLWDKLNLTRKYALMLHEVGHTYGAPHRVIFDISGKPASIMFPYDFEDELFRKNLEYFENDFVATVRIPGISRTWGKYFTVYNNSDECIKEIRHE